MPDKVKIDPRLMDEENFPSFADTTDELIRKHAIFRAEFDRICSRDLIRGADYWGGYDDTVANDLSSIEEWLHVRALRGKDKKALLYLSQLDRSGTISTLEQWLSTGFIRFDDNSE